MIRIYPVFISPTMRLWSVSMQSPPLHFLFDITEKATLAVYDVDDVVSIILYDNLMIDVTGNVERFKRAVF